MPCSRVLTRAAGGGLEIVWIDGEPGIGKSRLLAEVCTLAARAGYEVARGAATPFEQTRAFAPLLEALDCRRRGDDAAAGADRASGAERRGRPRPLPGHARAGRRARCAGGDRRAARRPRRSPAARRRARRHAVGRPRDDHDGAHGRVPARAPTDHVRSHGSPRRRTRRPRYVPRRSRGAAHHSCDRSARSRRGRLGSPRCSRCGSE